MLQLSYVYRWCDDFGGGIVVARNKDDAQEKLREKYGDERSKKSFVIWNWTDDEYFDESNPDVFDIY